jgi:1-acyl-sn-glycerol-3-phosphate acyltransferase
MIQNNVLLGVLKKWISRRVIATIGPDDLPAPPFIITANHTSYFDHFVLAWWLLCKGLPYPRFLSKAELFERPISRWFNHYGGGIPIARDKVDTEAFELTRQTLNDGGIIIMYAEGTRSRDGWLRIPHRGIASLAAQAGVPVIPVGLFGVNHVLPIGARWPKRKRRIVIYNGATLMPPEPDKEKEKNFALRIYEQIAMLTAQWPEFLSDFTPSKEMNWPQLDSP